VQKLPPEGNSDRKVASGITCPDTLEGLRNDEPLIPGWEAPWPVLETVGRGWGLAEDVRGWLRDERWVHKWKQGWRKERTYSANRMELNERYLPDLVALHAFQPESALRVSNSGTFSGNGAGTEFCTGLDRNA
jgi:hypothetical protein